LSDALMSAFAMFTLKDPSLLAFDDRRSDANRKALFGMGHIPSDTQTREILDPLDPERLRPLFGDAFRQLQRGKALEPFEFHDCGYLLSLDGTVFLVDQAQQLCCPLFRAVWKKLGSKRSLWGKLRSHFYHFTFRSMRQLYEAMLYDLAKGVPLPTFDTS
jgi:hypothetical protein